MQRNLFSFHALFIQRIIQMHIILLLINFKFTHKWLFNINLPLSGNISEQLRAFNSSAEGIRFTLTFDQDYSI